MVSMILGKRQREEEQAAEPAANRRKLRPENMPNELVRQKCEICARIASWILEFSFDTADTSLLLGTWSEYKQRGNCKTCKNIVDAVTDENVSTLKDDCSVQLSYSPYAAGFVLERSSICSAHESENWLNLLDLYAPLKLLGTQTTKHSSIRLPKLMFHRSLKQHSIDTDVLSKWVNRCDTQHVGRCHGDNLPDPQKVPPAPQMRLIDLEDNCLVLVPGTKKYICLSYVWGCQGEAFALKRASQKELSTIGIFDKLFKNDSLPATIVDAISVTKALGCRFLWIDRLCITQDDENEMREQLSWMHSIYANSYLTIVAMDGVDADSGIGRIYPRGSVSSSPWIQKTVSLNDQLDLQISYPLELSRLPWHSRAWTFQERYLSKRCLLFLHDTVSWECCVTQAWECLEETHFRPGGWPNNFPAKQVESWPNLTRYRDIVQRYSRLQLSRQSDAKAAFTAILSLLTYTFPQGFIFGIPAFYFDFGLSWYSVGGGQMMERREGFPSWSWLGWKGAIGYDVEFTLVHMGSGGARAFQRLKPTLQWFIRDEDSGEIEEIPNSYHIYQSMMDNAGATLPTGWTSSSAYSDHGIIHPESRFYAHEKIPNRKFRHPLPIASSPLSQSNTRKWSQHLQFSTEMGALALGTPYSFNRYNLVTQEGTWAGVLRPNRAEAWWELPEQLLCDLIVFSEGTAIRGGNFTFVRDELEDIEDLRDIDVYHYYLVLWVKWEHGIAYRQGIGRVWKQIWDKKGFSKRDIILG